MDSEIRVPTAALEAVFVYFTHTLTQPEGMRSGAMFKSRPNVTNYMCFLNDLTGGVNYITSCLDNIKSVAFGRNLSTSRLPQPSVSPLCPSPSACLSVYSLFFLVCIPSVAFAASAPIILASHAIS